MMDTRACSLCGEEFEKFLVRHGQKDGSARCRPCIRRYNQKRYAAQRAGVYVPLRFESDTKVCPHCHETFRRFGITASRPSGRSLCRSCDGVNKKKNRKPNVGGYRKKWVEDCLAGKKDPRAHKERRVLESQRIRF